MRWHHLTARRIKKAVLCPGDKDASLASTQLSWPHTISNWKEATQHFPLRNCYEPRGARGIIHILQALSAFLIVLLGVQIAATENAGVNGTLGSNFSMFFHEKKFWYSLEESSKIKTSRQEEIALPRCNSSEHCWDSPCPTRNKCNGCQVDITEV